MSTKLTVKPGFVDSEKELHSRGADRFELPLTETQRDEIIVALAIKSGIVQKPMTEEEIQEI